MVLISLENASLYLNHCRLLENIWLELQRGDVVCVVGKNGSGKSSLLKLLAGQHWHTSGQRFYYFTTPPRESPIGAPIALVAPEMQERYQRLEHDRTVLEVLATGFAQSDFLYTPLEPNQQQVVLEVAQNLELETLLGQTFYTLSKGQMRQVLLARAMLGQPQVLLLDEFFSGVDLNARMRLRQMVQVFLTQGGTLVYTTHRAEEPFVERERVLELAGGRAKSADGRPALRGDHLKEGVQMQIEEVTPQAWGELQKTLIQVQNANVYFGQLEDNATAPDGHQTNEPKLVLENINFRLLEGQPWLVTGHNGAGKSTFAKLLRGDLSPAVGGRVGWFGLEHLPIWERQARIALVSSDIQYAHRVDATGFEIIASGYFGGIGWHHELTPVQEKHILGLARALEIADLLERKALYASQGELRKLLLARAMVTTPRVTILDEAFDYLDAHSRNLVWKLLLEQPTTLVVIAHREEDKPPFATQHLELAQGKIIS